MSPIDWQKLWDINPDVIAWIEIPGTRVAYPILQHPYDNFYYLDYTIDHRLTLPGSIYVFSNVKKDFSDYNVVIYGHNMIDESMFGSLKNYRYLSHMESYPALDIYTPDGEYHYTIFGAVVYDDKLISDSYDSTWEPDREAFLNSLYDTIYAGSVFREDVEVTPEDHIVTLSTCIAGAPNNRLLIVAVRNEPDEAVS